MRVELLCEVAIEAEVYKELYAKKLTYACIVTVIEAIIQKLALKSVCDILLAAAYIERFLGAEDQMYTDRMRACIKSDRKLKGVLNTSLRQARSCAYQAEAIQMAKFSELAEEVTDDAVFEDEVKIARIKSSIKIMSDLRDAASKTNVYIRKSVLSTVLDDNVSDDDNGKDLGPSVLGALLSEIRNTA